MYRSQLEHIIRAASSITGCKHFLLLGSQAILGHYTEEQLAPYLYKSQKLDIAPIPDNQELSDLIDGCLGEFSIFNQTFGIWAHGNDLTTGFYPYDWEDRAIMDKIEGCSVIVPSIEDLAIAKYISNREKDREYLKNMWETGLINKEKIEYLLGLLPLERIGGEMCKLVSEKVYADINKYFPKNSQNQSMDM